MTRAAAQKSPLIKATRMWDQAEVVGLLDRDGRVTVVSRNEVEAPVSKVLGRSIVEMLTPASVEEFQDAFEQAIGGNEVEMLLSGVADMDYVFWGRVRLMPSPEASSPVLFHMRRLPTPWGALSERERDVVCALNEASMNAKRAAKRLNISVNTFNSHRRSICQKCGLHGVGDFWIFVQQCR
jgi:DNA-binding CsgD family transcriptional regulator